MSSFFQQHEQVPPPQLQNYGGPNFVTFSTIFLKNSYFGNSQKIVIFFFFLLARN